MSLPLVLWTAFVLTFATLSYVGRATEGKPKPDVLYQWSTLAAYVVQYLVIALIVWGIAGLGERRELFALRRALSVGTNVKYLIEAQSGKKLLAAITAVNDVEVTVTKFLQSQRHTRHRSHERGVHHGAIS